MKILPLLIIPVLALVGCTSQQTVTPDQLKAVGNLSLIVADVAVDTAHANGDLNDADYQKAKLAEAAAKTVLQAATTQPSK